MVTVIGWTLIVLGIGFIVFGAVTIGKSRDNIEKIAEANCVVQVQSTPLIIDNPSPDSKEEKGRIFEEYIVGLIPAGNSVILEEWQSDKMKNGRYPLSNRNPDLLLSIKLKGGIGTARVAIECKWRQSFNSGSLQWTTQEKIDIYRQYGLQKNAVVFIALGIGGTPDNPQSLYFVPLDKMSEPVVTQSHISEFRSVHTHGRLFYKDYTRRLTVYPPKENGASEQTSVKSEKVGTSV